MVIGIKSYSHCFEILTIFGPEGKKTTSGSRLHMQPSHVEQFGWNPLRSAVSAHYCGEVVMRTILGCLFGLFVAMTFTEYGWAQHGIISRLFRPPPRIPMPHPIPIHPVVPHLEPGNIQRMLPDTAHPIPIHADVPQRGEQGGSGSGVDHVVVILALVAGLGGIAGLVFGVRAWGNRAVAHLRILRTPPGEAPEEIRRAWVGIELPLRRGETEPACFQTVGVLSHRHLEIGTGYAVDGRAAVKALASHSPEAAVWWREHAPHVLEPGYRFWFACEVCQRVGSGLGQAAPPVVPTTEMPVTPPGNRAPQPIRLTVLGLGENGLGGVWLREVAAWEEDIGEVDMRDSRAETAVAGASGTSAAFRSM